ncbi:MAG: DUF4259 domain-containing protein [Gemmatimonadaceae bacterium]|nr:DUF4259 domain-containing protein [Gemmatimonadaceae bacterium]
MGIWDDDGFANDEALDWLARLDPSEGLQPLRQAMHAAIAAPDPALDARQAGLVLAAVELVAAAAGQPHPSLPHRATRWCREQREPPDEATLILATRALDFIGTSSGLAELWSQRADESGWHRELDSLRMRLTPAVVPPPA